MNPFPENHELIGFFESEPEVTDRDVPWFYNRLTFRYSNGTDTLVFGIEPGYGQIDMTWRQSGKEIASFALRKISSLEVKGAPGPEYLTVRFTEESLREFVLHTKPTLRVEWGNTENGGA